MNRKNQPGYHYPKRQKRVEDIHSDIVHFLNCTPNGSASFRHLHERFDIFPRNEVWKHIQSHESQFHIDYQGKHCFTSKPSGNEMIWIKSNLRLCERFCRKNKKCSGGCGNLHLCRTFLLQGNMHCPFQKSGKNCAFIHDFQTRHNSNLLKSHRLSHLNENELRMLFKRRICRSMSTMPQTCIYYNGKGGKGCSRNDKCTSLHLCLNFVLGKCPGRCGKNHSMSSRQVGSVLDQFAIDKSWTDKQILEDMCSIMTQRMSQSRDDDSISVASLESSRTFEEDDADNDDVAERASNQITRSAKSSGSETELKERVTVEEDVEDGEIIEQTAETATISCCSHCKETRMEMMKMKETLKNMEKEMQQMKAICSNSKSKVQEDTSERQSQKEKLLGENQQQDLLRQTILSAVRETQSDYDKAEKITDIILQKPNSELLDIMMSPYLMQTILEEAIRQLEEEQHKERESAMKRKCPSSPFYDRDIESRVKRLRQQVNQLQHNDNTPLQSNQTYQEY